MNSVRVRSEEGIQYSGSAALGSPSVNRDVGTTRPVYISSTLYWDQSARHQGHSQHTGLKRIHTHTIYRRPYVKYLYTGLLGERYNP